MQHSAQNGGVKREDRVPLAALVELRGVEPHGGQADELVEADGLNVSIGGIAMRTSRAPQLGQLIVCRFSCPPTGELVRAQGQVVWSEQLTPGRGAFGLRFVELDTKSATALRRLVSPEAAPEIKAERPRTAVLSIDGLGAPIDAGLKLADDSRVVLEQRLTFLQLGRSVEVTVPGRGKERGRIASVELRQTQFDVPTLVYGVLLDGAPGRVVDAADAGAAALFGGLRASVSEAELAEACAEVDVDESFDESALIAAALEDALLPDVETDVGDSASDTPGYSGSFGMLDEVESLSELANDVLDEELSHEPSSYYYSRVVAPAVRDKTQRERSSRVPPAASTSSDLNDYSDTQPGIGPTPSPFAETRSETSEADAASVGSVSVSAPTASPSSTPTSASASTRAEEPHESSTGRTLKGGFSLPPAAVAAALAMRATRDTRQELAAQAVLAYGELGADRAEHAGFPEDLDTGDDEHSEEQTHGGAYLRSRAQARASTEREHDVHNVDDDGDDSYPEDAEDEAPLELQPTPAELPALQLRTMPAHLRSLFRVPVAKIHSLRQRLAPSLRAQSEFLDLPEARSRLLLHLARGRALVLRGWSGLRKSTSEVRSRKTRPLRVQRTSLLGAGPAEAEAPRPPQTARIAALALALVGIGLGVYALAPRSGADRIRIPERLEPETALAEPTIELHDEGDPLDQPVVTPAPKPRPAKRAKQRAAAAADTVDLAPGDETAAAPPASSVVSAPFGEAEVPNGRVFTLRMNGPVELVEGEARPNGITVKVPGRLAVDRAKFIAMSHSAVERAMILNRGGYAELTIDFLPGLAPRYQVRGRDNTLEVTLERL